MFSAVLDICTLIPGRQRDFLLQLAAEGAYGAVWSSGTVDDELVEVLLRLDARRGRAPDRVRHERLVKEMKRHFPGSAIQTPRMRRYHYQLADPDDEHEVHAAIMGKASAIVTSDRKARFESCTDLVEAQIEVLTPQEFAANTVAAHPAAGVRALSEMATRCKQPPESPIEVFFSCYETGKACRRSTTSSLHTYWDRSLRRGGSAQAGRFRVRRPGVYDTRYPPPGVGSITVVWGPGWSSSSPCTSMKV